MKTIQKLLTVRLFPVVFTTMALLLISCSKDEATPVPAAYTCATCNNTPDALVANDNDVKGVYKGIVVGSTGTISIDIQNGSNAITATMVLDGVSIALTSSVSTVNGQPYVAPFTGTYNGNPVSITFSVGLGGTTPTMVSSDIPGHPNAVFNLYKETSTSLIEAFEGTYSKPGETGVFNILLSKGIGRWGAIAKANGETDTNTAGGTVNASNQIVEDNGTIMGTIAGDQLKGSFTDGNNATISISGNRTL